MTRGMRRPSSWPASTSTSPIVRPALDLPPSCYPRADLVSSASSAPVLQRLGKRLLLRQRPIATSIIYFRRFYLKNSFCDTDPYLVLATCSYVAAKLEETPVHIKSVVIEARQMYTGESSSCTYPMSRG